MKIVAEGYEHFHSLRTADLIRDLAAKTIPWMKGIEVLDSQGAPDDALRPIWAEVDAYDGIFDKLLEEEGGVYDALVDDLKKNPSAYIGKNKY